MLAINFLWTTRRFFFPLYTFLFKFGFAVVHHTLSSSQVASFLDHAFRNHERVAFENLPVARDEARTQLHEIERFLQYSKFLSKGSPGHNRIDLKVTDYWPDYHNSQVSRSCSDFVARYGLKALASYSIAAEQTEKVESDNVYLDGAHVCKQKRDYFLLQTCGLLSVLFHQRMDLFGGDLIDDNATHVLDNTFAETVGSKTRKRRILQAQTSLA